jgi:hypothetical protein
MFWAFATWFYTCIFSNHLYFSHLRDFALLLSELSTPFYALNIGLHQAAR